MYAATKATIVAPSEVWPCGRARITSDILDHIKLVTRPGSAPVSMKAPGSRSGQGRAGPPSISKLRVRLHQVWDRPTTRDQLPEHAFRQPPSQDRIRRRPPPLSHRRTRHRLPPHPGIAARSRTGPILPMMSPLSWSDWETGAGGSHRPPPAGRRRRRLTPKTPAALANAVCRRSSRSGMPGITMASSSPHSCARSTTLGREQWAGLDGPSGSGSVSR